MRILVVEDDTTLAAQLRAALEGAGFAVDVEHDGTAAAFAGALVLVSLGTREPLAVYQVFGREQQVSLLGLVIGALILLFVVLELLPVFTRLALDRRWLPVGGLVSGFFGGLSGHQGAFRSMFLVKAGLDKEAFVATGVVLAVVVDMARLVVYGFDLAGQAHRIDWPLVAAASGAAFADLAPVSCSS